MAVADLSPARLDVVWYRGDDTPVVIALPEGFDPDGRTWHAQAKRTPDDPLLADIDVEVQAGMGDDAGRWLLILSLTPAAADALAAVQVAQWDLEERPANETWFWGYWRVRKDVTQ